MGSTDIAILIGAQVVITALAVSIFAALRQRDRDLAAPREEERDEIAAAAGGGSPNDRSRTRFLATVSHEIRTPLNGVMGLAQLLDMTRLDAEQASYVEAILKSGRTLAQLIDDILDFSRIEAGKLALRDEDFELTPLVDGVLELLAPRAMAKGLEIAGFIAPDAPRDVTGDPARLRQVLVNLIGNAVNYTVQGGVGLRVSVQASELRFDVCDSGPGVPLSARDVIFEEFERVDWSSTQPRAGAGLGLAISRRLVEMMGGRLVLSDTSDAGSTFSVFLPLAKAAVSPAPQSLAGQSVLIVSESLFEGPYLAESLTCAGAEATIMAAGPAGDLLARKDGAAAHHAVILDCGLGPETTPALVKAARASGAGRLLLLFSPLERRAFGQAALRDVDGWLVKPVRKASLLARLLHAPSHPSANAGRAVFPTLKGLRILLAEDNDVNALIVTRALEKFGAQVTRASDGARAVALSTEGLGPGGAPFDAILMDLFLPELDGRDATRRIRGAEVAAEAPQTPIVVLTASALEEDARAARAAGADALLIKPFDLAELAATLDELRVARTAPSLPSPRSGSQDAFR